MKKYFYKLTRKVFKGLYGVISPDLKVMGTSIRKSSTLFVANHFTNIETLLIPHIVKDTSGILRSLAKDELFTATSRDYLNALGIFSVKRKNRDNLIMGDLISGTYNWIIYPEGMMVKNKVLVNDKRQLFLQSPHYNGRPRTGAAVMALKSYMTSYFYNKKKGDVQYREKVLNDLMLTEKNNICDDISIQPITITFYPLHTMENTVGKLITWLGGKSVRSQEELLSETSFLLKGNISVYFHEPILIKQYVKKYVPSITWFLPETALTNMIVGGLRWKLTREFMTSIYKKVFINIDHLFAFYLFNRSQKKLSLLELKDFLFYASRYILNRSSQYNTHSHLQDMSNVYFMKKWKPYDLIWNLALQRGIIVLNETEGLYEIDNEKLHMDSDFKHIRYDNPFIIMYNEFLPLYDLTKHFKKMMDDEKKLSNHILKEVVDNQMREFKQERQLIVDNLTFPERTGKPRFVHTTEDIAILMCHGYLASPMELDELASVLTPKYTVYQMRLRGHGTHNEHLKTVSHKTWLSDSLELLIALKKNYKKVIALGFSTGATVMLNNYFRTQNLIDGLITLSPALEIADPKNSFVPGIMLWNRLSKKLNLEKYQYDKIKNSPGYEETNYRFNHVYGVEQLNKVVNETKEMLGKIYVPTLVMQSFGDTVIKPTSAAMVAKCVPVDFLEYMTLRGNEHTIVRGKHAKEVQERVLSFLKKNWK